jgi:hypothetical protein
MIPDIAQGVVLDGFKDENIADHYGNEVLVQLKRLPPEWRQNAMAAVVNRCYTTSSRPSSHNRDMLVSVMNPVPGKNYYDELVAVVDEILEQIK